MLRADRASANVLLRVDDNRSNHLLDVARSAEEWWRAHGPPGTDARTTGIMFEFARAEDEIAMGQIRGLAASLLVVGALAFVIFRALRVAAVAILPDAVPLVLTFGFMGLAGIPLDAATVVVGCLALGIAVDDTIHLLAGFTEHPRHREDPRAALEDTFRRVLPPMLLTTLAIAIGFGVLGLSRVRADAQLRSAHGGERARGAAHEPDAAAGAAAARAVVMRTATSPRVFVHGRCGLQLRLILRNSARTVGSFIIPPKPLQSSVVVWLVTVCERHLRDGRATSARRARRGRSARSRRSARAPGRGRARGSRARSPR